MLRILSVLASGLALVSAYHAPGVQVSGTNPINTPNTAVGVVVGTPFTVSYDGSGFGDKISLLLWRGPADNLVFLKPIADAVANTGSFSWTPDSSLPDDVTHYGLQLVSEVDGRYQWSTQFGVSNKGGVSSAAPAPSSTAPARSSTAPASVSKAPSSSAPAASVKTSSTSSVVSAAKNGTISGTGSTTAPTTLSYNSAPLKPTGGYTGPASNNAGRFAFSAISAVVALGAAVLVL